MIAKVANKFINEQMNKKDCLPQWQAVKKTLDPHNYGMTKSALTTKLFVALRSCNSW